MNKQDFLNKKRDEIKRPLLLDGAMGSYLSQLGFESDKYLWYSHLNFSNPETITKIHKEYIDAGADIITTNTFRTNPLAIKRSNFEITTAELVKKSVKIAIEAKAKTNVIIAGSNAPAEDCYQNERTVSFFELEYNHKKHIELLYESGCESIWNETHSHLDEIEIICKYCSVNKIPFTMNLFFNENLHILSGHHLNNVIEIISNYSPQSIGFNCVRPSDIGLFMRDYSLPNKFGFYLNCANSLVNSTAMNHFYTPQDYIVLIDDFLQESLVYVGSCCGSNPAFTKALREHIDEIY